MGSRSKDASSKLHEKHQAILADMLRDDDNKFCADCHAKGPRWASWNIGVFMCIRCAGIHRNLGVHISRVKSVNLDSWTPEQIETIQKGGNGRARELYEANLPANFRRPQDDYAVEQFIRSKYERKQYIAKGTQTATKETEKKSTSKHTSAKKDTSSNRISKSNKIMSVPRPASGRQSPSPQPMKTSPTPVATSKTSSGNLVDFDSAGSSNQKQTTPQSDWLTGAPTSSSSAAVPNLMDIEPQQKPTDTRPAFAFDPGFVSSQQNASSVSQQPQQPSLVPDPGLQPSSVGSANVRTSIMSLYSAPQPQYNSYTPQGYPVNAYYYQQQQQAAMRMAQVAQQQQVQVNQVQQQMAQIKLNRSQQPITSGNPSAPPNTAGFGAGGQTLNPHLW